MLSDEPQIQFAVYHNIGLYLINPIHIMSVDSSHADVPSGVHESIPMNSNTNHSIVGAEISNSGSKDEINSSVMPDKPCLIVPVVDNSSHAGCCIIM
jgi:hypothetical protein